METVLRDVLVVFRSHPREWLAVDTIARDSGRPKPDVETIVVTLAECFVLDFDRSEGRYRYQPAGVLELDVSDYLTRVDAVNDRLQNNVARFRSRFGYD
jgi:DNA-binding IclR family transcriptional regulator